MKKKTGRKSLGKHGRTITLAVKVTAIELKTWRKLAKADDMPLGPWLLKPRRKMLEK